jgi:ketosteroid isomerase-like protein
MTRDNIALLRRIWDPIAQRESGDIGPFFDALADDIVFKLPVGELHGKQAVIDYFTHAQEAIEANPFDKPLEYFCTGDRVVILGDETFKVRETGIRHQAEWAWVHDVHDGVITRIVAIQDLSGVADAVRGVLSKVQSASERAGGRP